jgi:nucleolar protein 15
MAKGKTSAQSSQPAKTSATSKTAKASKTAKPAAPVAEEEPLVQQEVQVAAKDKKSKKRTIEKTVEESDNLIIQPNQKKTKLSTSLRPLDRLKAGNQKNAVADTLSSIVYLGHLPSGFDEDEIRKFFNQYGKIKRMKLFRSKKSNAPKGYAFLEFETQDIAAVVADSMNGYYLMEKQLVSHVLPKDAVHEGLFMQRKELRSVKKNAKLSPGEASEEDGDADELTITEENFEAIYQKHRAYTQKKQEKLREKGVDFQIPLVAVESAQVAPAAAESSEEPAPSKQKKDKKKKT